ncbi:hypothetical protein [Streptosporangium lutulentum]|uniref:Uncharacterized protein n=1 Tax=Streptosporangium lutulentum TaxID=1461250 RepID=A0ABT9QFX2_9ACTN|nr:hypothetical protein [Streptosporangium lutulentum]MDP9845667.1 hypothetical protein [Streptosporangium lutulentum]
MNAGTELARLRGLLKETKELPDGFSARQRDAWKPPFRPVGSACRLVLDAAGGSPPQWAPGARVSVTYPGYKIGELAGVGLASYTGDEAEAHFAELTRALGGCPVVASHRRASKGTSFKVSNLDLEGVGGDVQARRLKGRLNGYPYEMHLVFARAGSTLVSLVHAGVARVDIRRTRQFARFLIDRAAS